MKIFIWILFVSITSTFLYSCSNSTETGLRLYEVCTKNETKNELSIPTFFNDEAINKIFVCVDQESEFRIEKLKNIEIKYYEIINNNLRVIDKKEFSNVENTSSLYAILFLHLLKKDADRYKSWLNSREQWDEVVITLNNNALSTFRLKGALESSYIRFDVGTGIDLVDNFSKQFHKLVYEEK